MRLLLVSSLCALVVSGCADKSFFEPPGPPQLAIVPTSATLRVGERHQFVAMVGGDFGGPWTVTWWSSAPLVAVVDTGIVTARAVGSALIVVRIAARAVLEDTASVTVQ